MQIKKFKLFKWDSILFGDYIWAAMVILPTSAMARAMYYNYVVLGASLPIGALASFAVVLAGFYGITAYRFFRKDQFIKSIRSYTRHGLAVVFSNDKARANLSSHSDELLSDVLSVVTEEVLKFFVRWNNLKAAASVTKITTMTELSAGLNGGVLEISDKPFAVVSTHGPVGPMFKDKVLGLQYLNRLTITWDNVVIRNTEDFLKLFRHEVGHYCLEQLGYLDLTGGTEHHKIFEEAGFLN